MMTQEDKENIPADPVVGTDGGSFEVLDYSTPPRDQPMIHPAVDPPLCEGCLQMELQFFDPGCPGCQDMLTNQLTTVPEILAILRQWTPQTQQNLEILIREILKRGAHINDRDGLTDMTMLHYCCKAGANGIGDVDECCRMANLLISKYADIYIRCRWTNMTALHYATYFDVAPVIMILLKASKGIDIDSPCTEFDRGTPLHIAATNMACDAAKVLLQNGADPWAKDDLSRTPLDCVPDPGAFDPESEMGKLVSRMRKMFQEAQETKAVRNSGTGPARDALQALGLKIGHSVVVGGVKTGTLRYCGPTEFAAGIWAGIELDEPAGKNDGSVGGVSYFKCSHKYGIFAPVSKINRPGILSTSSPQAHSTPRRASTTLSTSFGIGKVDTSRITAKVDTGLAKSFNRSIADECLERLDMEERVIVAGQRKGTVRFSGETEFAPGWWYGIELDRPVGKNDGSVNGKTYFTCKPKYGVFAPPSRIQKYSDLHGSRESLDFSALLSSVADRQRRLSVGSTSSQQSFQSQGSKNRPKSSGVMMRRSFATANPGSSEFKLQEGMSVFCSNELGFIRYIGPVDFADGIWLGVELRTAKGKNDGSVQGKRYFTCKHPHGLIVRPSKVTVRGINGAKLLGDLQMPSTSENQPV